MPDKYKRKSIRIREYDYSQPNWYYITICSYKKECIFGEIKKGVMVLNEFGKIAKTEWEKTKDIRKNIELDYFIIMPNHIHGIIIIEKKNVGAHCNVPLPQTESFGKSTKNTIPTIVKLYKSAVTKQINILRNSPGHPVWQRNYYEHIIRNDKELYKLRQYIHNNSIKWEDDEYHNYDW
jgi:putative transposase